MALSLDIILVGEILKYRYTACIPSCLDYEDVFMLACIDMSSMHRSSLRVLHGRGPSIDGPGQSILWVWFPACPQFSILYSKVTLGVRVLTFVRCPESSSVCFSEVALALQLC